MSSALLTLYRSLTRHRLFAVLNIGGLALGIATFLVLFLFVRFETGYDRVLPGWDRVWVVRRTMQFPASPEVMVPSTADLLGHVLADWPDVQGARMLTDDVPVKDGAALVVERVARVDPTYFTLFPLPVVTGDPRGALAAPDGAVVTRRVAETYFGRGSAIGRTLTLVIAGKPVPFRVGAVVADPPAATSDHNAIFTALPAAGRTGAGPNGMLTTFVRFPDPRAAAARAATFPALSRRHPDADQAAMPPDIVKQSLVPLAAMHLADPQARDVVGALGLVGMLALLVAIANYINLATARAGLRAREVAIRKVVGATRTALVGQFLGEAMATAALAGLLGLALAELALPFVNAAGGMALAIDYAGAGSIVPPLLLLIAGVGLVAGLYPAFVLARFRPAAVLAAVRSPGGSRAGLLLRRAMVVVQFAIVTTLMIGTAVLVAQMRHLQSSDLGFDRAGLIAVGSFGDATLDESQRRAFAAAVVTMPGVVATTRSAVAPAGGSFGIGPMHRDGATGPDPMIVRADVGTGFFTTYGARLVAGRVLDTRRYRADDADLKGWGPTPIVLNRTAVRLLGFASPAAAVGRGLRDGTDGSATIVGVIADIRFKSPRDAVEPQAYSEHDRDLTAPVLAVRHTGQAAPLLDAMATQWRRIAPAVPFTALPVDRQLYEAYYRADAQRTRLFLIGAVLAVVIGCLGLYGLAAFDTERRLREIGIRKALGASSAEVLRLLIRQFLRPVLLAGLIAVPIAYLVMRRWLAGFDDRIALSPAPFVIGVGLASTIAVATVLGQSWRAARGEPWRALRDE